MGKLSRKADPADRGKQSRPAPRPQKQSKDSLQELEENYRSLIENINDVLYTLDDQGTITNVSPVVERLTQYKVDELVGHSFAPLVHPDDLPGLMESFGRLMEGRLEPWEFRVLDKDGRIIYVRSSSRPIVRDGQIIGATALVTDITDQKLAYAALQEKERLYRLVTDNATDIIWTAAMDGTTTYISPSVTAARGFSVDEAMHQSYEQRYAKRSIEEVRSILQNALAREAQGKMLPGEVIVFEAEHLKKDGTALWMETRASFARDENGRAVGIVGVTRDISQRKTADAVINKQRTEYRTILDSVPLIITYVNTEGKFIRINRSGAAALGSSPKEVVGKTFHDFFAKEEADRLLTRCREVMEFKAPTRNSISRVTLPSGQRIWANTDIIPYLDENGMVIGSINVVQDISERILAEHAHRDSEERFRNMTDLLPQTVFETDEKANFTFVNRQGYETFGFSEGDVANGMNVLQTIIPEDKARAIDNISRRIKGERFIPQEYTAVRKDGSRFPVLIYANPIIRDSKYAGMRGILVDITERKQLELSLEQSIADLNKTLDDIIATMSTIVELKDPYTAGHQKRVARLAAALAEEIGLPANKVDYIRTAALIHDIGKLYVPSDIMSKPGKLSDLEYKIIRTHSESSHDILKSIDFPWPIADIAWQHHERMDGSGYPVGLKSDEILVEARILAVADVVEAMASHRPYRPALGVDQALEEISANRDKLYDSVVVDACIRLFKEKAFTLG